MFKFIINNKRNKICKKNLKVGDFMKFKSVKKPNKKNADK